MQEQEREQYKNIIISLYNLKMYKDAIHYFELHKEEFNDLCYYAAVCYDNLDKKELAIKYYEQSLKYFNDYMIYGNLARLYADVYIFGEREKQFYYAKKAYELNPNDPVNVFNMLLVTCKFNEPAEKYFKEIQKFNPNYSVLFSYGCYLIRNRNFEDGFKLYRYRIEHDKGALPDGLHDIWQPNIDISDKTILVTYEQGFGDTLMFIRFVEKIKCKELKILVQDELYDLISYNYKNVYRASERDKIEYDYFVPMLDVPLLIGLTPETIDQKDGYLKVPGDTIKLETDKFKVGICFAGSKDGIKTCRDIPLKKLYPLFDLDVQFYLFQKEDIKHEIEDMPDYNVIDLSNHFHSWLDTAKYMKQMDLMITVDCGVLNLAGSIGVKTWALFNKYPEFRWFYLDKDIGWYNIKPYQCTEFNGWEEPVKQIKKDLQKVI